MSTPSSPPGGMPPTATDGDRQSPSKNNGVLQGPRVLGFLLTQLLDLGGTFVFAVSGGLVAVAHGMDLFGILVLAFATGNAGGAMRDLLIGAVPPGAVSQVRYLAVSVIAGLVAFLGPAWFARIGHATLWFDAVGLAFFVVIGTEKALAHKIDPVMAALMGMLTGIGGGMLRDVLANQIPLVLRTDLYASAALAGAVVIAGGRTLGLPRMPVALAGAAACLALRAGAIQYGWHLPHASM